MVFASSLRILLGAMFYLRWFISLFSASSMAIIYSSFPSSYMFRLFYSTRIPHILLCFVFFISKYSYFFSMSTCFSLQIFLWFFFIKFMWFVLLNSAMKFLDFLIYIIFKGEFFFLCFFPLYFYSLVYTLSYFLGQLMGTKVL